MFGFKRPNPHNKRPKNVRARDGWVRRTSAQRRAISKYGGHTKKEQRRVVKENRAYKSGKRFYRGKEF